MARPIQVLNFQDATGGLNLRANQFTLGDNESPDLLNVDIDPRGGVRIRNGVEPWGAHDTTVDIHSLTSFRRVGQTAQLIAGWGTDTVKYSTGGAWNTIVTLQTTARPFSSFAYNDILYIQNGTDKPIRWTGSAASRLDQDWNADFDLPTTGDMPIARCVAVFANHAFVANTYESSSRVPNLLRWSHPGFPESWREEDQQPIESGIDGDEIMALTVFGDQLLIFKRNSLHVLMGYSWDTFQIDNVAAGAGACGSNATVATPFGVFFWSHPEGPCVFDGKGVQSIADKLRPLIDDQELDGLALDRVVAGFIGNRVWFTVPTTGGLYRTFIFDPTVGKGGSWTEYDLHGAAFVEWAPDSAANAHLIAPRTIGNLDGGVVLDQSTLNQPYDQTTIGGDLLPIDSHYTTPWFDGGQPAIKKRWRRPMVVYRVIGTGSIAIEVYHNYDSGDAKRHQNTVISQASGAAEFDDADSLWDGEDPDDMWAAGGSYNHIVRESSLGTAHAVQLRFEGPVEPVVWGIDSITIPFIPRRIR